MLLIWRKTEKISNFRHCSESRQLGYLSNFSAPKFWHVGAEPHIEKCWKTSDAGKLWTDLTCTCGWLGKVFVVSCSSCEIWAKFWVSMEQRLQSILHSVVSDKIFGPRS